MNPRISLMALATLALPSPVRPQDPDVAPGQLAELQERITELEDQQARISERLGSRALAQGYTATSLDVGGHVSSLFTHMRGENDSTTGHLLSVFELYLKARIDEQWSLFATPAFYTYNVGFLDDPSTTGDGDPAFRSGNLGEAGLFLSRAYGEWKHGDALQVQAGIVGSPHGTTNREHFVPSRMIGQGSLHTRLFLANALYPQVVQGAKVSGKLLFGGSSNWLEYDAYAGVEDAGPADMISGARLACVVSDLGLSLAANYGRGARESVANGLSATDGATAISRNVPGLQAPFAARVNGTRDYEFVGVDIDWRVGSLISKTEAYISAEGSYRDQRAASTEWTWFVQPQWGVSYRFDYYHAGSDLAIVSLSPFQTMELAKGHSTEHVVGLAYNPNESVRIRLDLHHNNLPNTADTVDFINLSWSVSF